MACVSSYRRCSHRNDSMSTERCAAMAAILTRAPRIVPREPGARRDRYTDAGEADDLLSPTRTTAAEGNRAGRWRSGTLIPVGNPAPRISEPVMTGATVVRGTRAGFPIPMDRRVQSYLV